MVRDGRYLEATDRVLKKHGGLVVQRRNLCDFAPPCAGLNGEMAVTASDQASAKLARAAAVRVGRNLLARASVARSCGKISPSAPMSPSRSCPATIIATTSKPATALRRAGFNPVPHIAAREMPSREALDDFLARARGEADVSRILLIAGDVAAAKGPFKSTRDVCASGLIEAHGIASVSLAGHPEGHPFLELSDALNGLKTWRDWGRRTETRVDVVTQFCFESAPILQWIAELDHAGIDLPVIVGLAGPATPATLTKFALRCGIGNSMRARCGARSAGSAGC